MEDAILQESCFLSGLGFNIIFLKPKLKRPIENNWQCTKKRNEKELIADYQKIYSSLKVQPNIGTVLGEYFAEQNAYLIGIDIDLREDTKENRAEVSKALKTILTEPFSTYPCVISGGNLKLSRHFYVLSKILIPTTKFAHSGTQVAGLDGKKHYAWEIDIGGKGKQFVLPPSIHPDTGSRYVWVNKKALEKIPVVDFTKILEERKTNLTTTQESADIDNSSLEDKILNLPTKTLYKITEGVDGENLERDRSSLMMDVMLSLAHQNFSIDEILEVMTKAEYKISEKTLENRSLEKAKAWLLPQIKKAMITVVSQNIDAKNSNFIFDKNGNLIKSILNTLAFLHTKTELQNIVKYNTFSERIEICKKLPWSDSSKLKSFTRGWTDDDTVLCKVHLAQSYGYEIGKNQIDEAMIALAHLNRYHPIKDYLDSLVWDDISRIDTWLIDYCKAEDNIYVRDVSRKVLLAAVARIYDAGCKFDNILVLEGKQGIGKSPALSILGGDWFADSIGDINNKDAVAALQAKWIIELSELEPVTKAQSETLKAFISRQSDRCRLAYERHVRDFPRQCIFIGTTNNSTYLKDETGGRRFWPVKLNGFIDLKKLTKNRDQLWAEARDKYFSTKEILMLDRQASAILSVQFQEEKREHDDWEDYIAAYLSDNNKLKITGRDIWVECFGKSPADYDRRIQKRISCIMQALNWERKPFRDERGALVKGFVK